MLKFIVFNLIVAGLVNGECPIKLEPIGCYQDNLNDRVFPEQIINERDKTSNVYNGHLINWLRFDTYLPEFLCRCATKAREKGYRMIGAQFYGECWSGHNAHVNYKRKGAADTCIDSKFRKSSEDGKQCAHYVGTHATNFVYRIAPTECDISYKPVGCYHDRQAVPRPLPTYLINERDPTTNNWNGVLIDWENWNRYSPRMICRCANFARMKGHSLFAIQFWGECWTGDKKTSLEYDRDGPSNNCRAENFNPCPCNSYHCVGKAFTNYVYNITSYY